MTFDEHDFVRFRDWFHERTGIHYEPHKRYFVERRVLERMRANGCRDFASYWALLRGPNGEAELQALINRMTINETYFFRESAQLHFLVRDVLPEVLTRKPAGKPIRVWSIPCATGEEPYSIALLMLESAERWHERGVQVFGCDIDSDAVAHARAGRFPARSLQRVTEPLRSRYFRKVGEEWFEIDPRVRAMVTFAVANLCNADTLTRWRDMDVIFCRNLLIYFDERSRRRALDHLCAALAPGGYLFLGHAETARDHPGFEAQRLGEVTVYRKAG